MLLPTFTFRILMSLKQFWGCGDFALYDLIILGGPKCQFCTFWRRRQVWNRILFTLSSFSQFAFWSMFAKLVELVPTEIHWLLFLSRVFTQNQQFKMSSSVVSQTKQNLLMPLTTFWVVVAFAAADCFTSFFVVKDIINVQHGVWKSQKKSHSTLRAKRATFTFWVDISWLKIPKNVQFWRFFNNLKLAVKQRYQTGQFLYDKN